MSGNKEHFETDYINADSTQASEPPAQMESQDVDVEGYGDGKPKRVIIRARITHGS